MPGYEYTPLGIVPLGDGQAVANGIDVKREVGTAPRRDADAFEARMGAAVERLGATGGQSLAPGAERAAAPVLVAPLAPRDLVRQARARIKALDAELRRLAAVRRERDELQRLVNAAALKPVAKVRPIRSA